MKIYRSTLIALLLCSTTAIAEPASESSIKQLLAVTQSEKLVDDVRTQFDSLMNNVVQQAIQGKALTPKQLQAITNFKNRVVEIVEGELVWEKLEPMSIRLYKESFSEEEVAGMLAFYKTPAGQAVIFKMPVLTQQIMIETHKMMNVLLPKIKVIEQQFAAELAAASK
jgi:hypothetical protein